MHVKSDYSAVSFVSVSCESADGTIVETDGFVIPVIVPASEIGEWLAAYDPTSSTSPSAADSRKIARVVMDALKRKTEE